ncbi:MAG: DUF2793 domain-containing protein [Parvularculaceae bacterium]
MEVSPRLGLSYLQPQQAQKHVTVNESLRRLDAIVQCTAASRSLAQQPAAPAEGDVYILPAGASGADWTQYPEGSLAAFQDGAWREIAPKPGWRVHVADEAAYFHFHGGGWMQDAGGAGAVTQFGVNTTADAQNRLAVKSDAVLFSHDDITPGAGDARVSVNKSAAAQTASVVFQNAFSGRAEFGLAGSDDFSVKVSADGASWKQAMTIRPDGKIGFGASAPAAPLELHVDGAATSPALISSDDFILTKQSTASAFAGILASDSGAGVRMVFKGTRARGTLDAPQIVSNGDYTFSLLGAAYDGAGVPATAGISFRIDGATAPGVVPQRIVFETGEAGSRSERVRITAAGDVGIGVTAPKTKLDVDGAIRCKSYAAAALPSASASGAGAIAFVSDESGGAVLAFSDGANWRRTTDRAIVS